jgi:hypothetical protein
MKVKDGTDVIVTLKAVRASRLNEVTAVAVTASIFAGALRRVVTELDDATDRVRCGV